jgi:papain like protease
MTYFTGHIPDPDEVVARRKGFHILKARRMLGAAALPLKTNNRQWLLPAAGGPGVRDQSATSRCEGFAHAVGITLRFAIKRTPISYVSHDGIYTGARMISRVPNADGTLPPLSDDGTEPGLVAQALGEWGACSAKTWGDEPDDPSKVNVEPTIQQLEAEGEFRLDGAYFLQSSGDQYIRDLMTALAAGFPVTGAIAASGSIFQNYSGGVLGAMDDGVDHATLWLDYEVQSLTDLSTFVVYGVNSWGEGWGESTVTGINGGMYRGGRDFAAKYNSATAVLDVSALTGGSES